MARFVPGEGPVDRRALIESMSSEGLDVTEWADDPCATYPKHSHPHREIRVVLSGEMTIRASRLVFVLGPGDRLDLDPDEAHSAVVGSAGVTYLAGSRRRDD